MNYYDWNKIVSGYKDDELLRIYHDRFNEPNEKVEAVKNELIQRQLLDTEKEEIIKPKTEKSITDIKYLHNKTQPNSQRAKAAMIGLTIVLVLYIASSISSYLQYNLLIQVKNGIFISDDLASKNDNREMIIGVITFIAYAITSIIFLTWFYRAYLNLHLRIKNVELSEGWSIGAWFVPIISLFRPFNIMDELNKKSDLILKHRSLETGLSKPSLIGLWWGLFVLSELIGKAILRVLHDAEDIDGYLMLTIVSLISSIIGIFAAIITIQMVQRFSVKEELLYQSEINFKSI